MNYEHLMKHTIRQMERERERERERKRALQHSEEKHQLKFMEHSFFKVLKEKTTKIIYKGE